jgi:hypothetical protein
MTNTSFEASISLGMGARETLGSDIQGGVKAKTEEENSWLLSKVKENEKVPPWWQSGTKQYRYYEEYSCALARQ